MVVLADMVGHGELLEQVGLQTRSTVAAVELFLGGVGVNVI
jgi:hypothetical protein